MCEHLWIVGWKLHSREYSHRDSFCGAVAGLLFRFWHVRSFSSYLLSFWVLFSMLTVCHCGWLGWPAQIYRCQFWLLGLYRWILFVTARNFSTAAELYFLPQHFSSSCMACLGLVSTCLREQTPLSWAAQSAYSSFSKPSYPTGC